MKMKMKSLLFFLAFLVGTGNLMAQTAPERPKHDPEKRLAQLTTDLELTPDQQEAIREIDESFKGESEALRKKHETLRAETKSLRDAKRKEMNKVLTPEQQTKLEEIHKERGPNHRGKRGKGPRPERRD